MPAEQSLIPKTVNPDLQKERKAASFNVEEFATWWHGGTKKLKLKRDLEQYVYNVMKEQDPPFYYNSNEEVYDVAVKESITLAKTLREFQAKHNPGGNDIWPELYGASYLWGAIPEGNPFGVQFGMMVKAIKTQGTDEQFEEFGKRTANFSLCGAYAQTELGHGTFLRGLETRADYDRKTQQFVLNTPSITAYKWWPGGLGHSTNYCIVVAQLYIDDQAKGVHMFIVQVRDEETHMPLPGVDIGDIGVKLGFFGVNNGYLGLKNVRVPLKNMMMRNSKVAPDGTYTQSPVSVLTYFTMVFVRCFIARNNATMLSMGATIATRYSAVRRQSPINPSEPEPQVIDHVTQQYKLFPEIATAIAYRLSADILHSIYEKTTVEIEKGHYARLPELHSLACSLKALGSYDSTAGIERLRLSCGGHGYLTSSNMGMLYVSATAACTYEGENTVLLLQVGRFLMKSWQAAINGKMLVPTVAYLAEAVKGTEFGKWNGSAENIVKAIQFAAANKVRLAFENMSKRLKSGQTEAEAANNSGVEFLQAAELHGRAFIAAAFMEEVKGGAALQRSASLNKVLTNLLELYLIHTAQRHMSSILPCINLSDTDLCELQDRLEQLLKRLRPDAVAICDGFDYHDRNLKSTLGAYDGNVYERIFTEAKKSPLNKQPVPKSFHEHLGPFLKSNL